MAIYLSRKKGGAVATPITPSNASPAALTANTPVNPTANGYAIASYNTKTPSNFSPVALTSGEIDKINGNGYAIESYSSITPSNSSPATITSGSIYKASANGKAVASVTNVTPSSTPTSVSANDVVKIGGSGVIVDSIPSITPSNSSPVALSTNTPVNPADSGYAIASYEEIDVPRTSHHHTIRPDMPTISRIGVLEGVEQLHFHSIDPSNSDPATISDGEIYRADSSGKAVASVTDVIPSSTPTSVSMDDVVHIYGSGVIVDSIPVPPSVTPSNSSPAALTANTAVTPSANGYAIASYSSITPSNSTPVSLSSGSIYKPSASGYAISSYSSKTPSDSSPASVSSGAIIKASASGYLYSSSGLGQYVNITNTASKDETFSLSGGSTTSISVTSKPKLILWFSGNYGSSVSAGYGEMGMYDGIRNKYRRVTYYSSGGNTATDGGDITSVTSSSVSFKNNGSTYRRYHVMIWY